MAEIKVVSGEINFPFKMEAVTPARVLVELEDVSRTDVPSEVVARQELEPGELVPGSSIPFELQVPVDLLNERNSYSVRVHVDVSGSGEVERGDLITTQSYPVLTRGGGDTVNVTVKQI